MLGRSICLPEGSTGLLNVVDGAFEYRLEKKLEKKLLMIYKSLSTFDKLKLMKKLRLLNSKKCIHTSKYGRLLTSFW